MNNYQKGFSLVELLIVIVMIGIISAIGIPSLIKAVEAAENGSAFSAMRTISTVQLNYYAQNKRYGRLAELNDLQAGGLGTVLPSGLRRGKFMYQMSPSVTPTDAELNDAYEIIATREAGSLPYVISVNQQGYIKQILP